MVKRVDVAVYGAIKEAAHGEFHPGMRVLGLRDLGIDYVHEGPHGEGIPADVRSKVEDLRGEVVRGERKIPSG